MPDETIPTPMYDPEKKTTLGHLASLAMKVKGAVDSAIEALPVEMFLDGTKSAFADNFTWSEATYPGSTNPGLNGKPVLILAMNSKDNKTGAVTTSYHFFNMNKLVDIYTAKAGNSAKVLNISGYEIEVKVDPSTANKLRVTDDGLLVDVRVSGATDGHLAGLDGSGNLTDSGISGGDILTKLSGATTGDIVKVKADGGVEDAGILASNILTTADVATDEEVETMLNSIFG